MFYRATTQQQAVKYGLKGYAINLADGDVEVLLCGEEEKVRAVSDWLWQGPMYARVSSVECERVDVQAPQRFTTD